jgi:glycosyltransferase involved in cell wall biosynthesis
VITPCYNQGHFLAEAIDSILAQSYPHRELIVVDDGSTDQTAAVAAGYGDRIRYLYKPNAGLSAARNTGLLQATGEFVLFLDSDDALDPAAIERHVEAAAAHPSGTVFHGAHQCMDVAGRKLRRYEAASLGEDPFHRLLAGNPSPPHVHLIRRAAFARVGLFDVSLRSSEDWDMWLRLAAAEYEFVRVPDALAIYRTAPGSMSKHFDRMWTTGIAVLEKSRAYHENCRLCRQSIARGVRLMRPWCFDLLMKELYALKAKEGIRASIAKAAAATRRDPILAAWLFREGLRYMAGQHARQPEAASQTTAAA